MAFIGCFAAFCFNLIMQRSIKEIIFAKYDCSYAPIAENYCFTPTRSRFTKCEVYNDVYVYFITLAGKERSVH